MPNPLGYLEIISRINERCLEENMQCLNIIWGKNNKYNTNCKLTLKCLTCGDITIKSYGNFVTLNQGCKRCKYNMMGIKQTLDERFVIREINKILKNEELIFGHFENGYKSKKKSILYVQCLKCGRLTKSTYEQIYRKGLKCRYCHNKQYTEEEIIKLINEKCKKLNFTFIGFKEGNFKTQYNSIIKLHCNKCNNDFSLYTNYFLYKCEVCKVCEKTSSLERNIMNLLKENNIEYEYVHHFKELSRQSVDFYLPKYNIAIECQGWQHFEPINYFGGKQNFENISRLDNRKLNFCKVNNIKLLYYTDYPKTNEFLGEPLYKDLHVLLEIIKGCNN